MSETLGIQFERNSVVLLNKIREYLEAHTSEAYLVGGFVRDALIGRPGADIDIIIDGDALKLAPNLAKHLGGHYFPLDLENRVVRLLVENRDGSAGTEKWEIDIAAMQGGLLEDLQNRDFTIDAIAVRLSQFSEGATLELVDPFNGCGDIENKTVKAVTADVFKNDAARLLRAVRLAAELDFSIDSGTEDLIKRDNRLLAGVAGERVREELLRLFRQDRAAGYIRYLDELRLLTGMFPELEELRGVSQPKEHQWDVFNHSLETVFAAEDLLGQRKWPHCSEEARQLLPFWDGFAEYFSREVGFGSTRASLFKLGALLHDLGKPATRTFDESGRMRFLGHADEGARMTETALERLRFSRKEILLVGRLVKYHMRPTQLTQDDLPTHRAIYRFFRDTGDAGIDVLYLSLADHLAARGDTLDMEQWKRHTGIVRYVLDERLQKQEAVLPPKLVNGNEVSEALGIPPGPELGKLLEAVREAQAAGEIATRAEALVYIRDCLLSKGCK